MITWLNLFEKYRVDRRVLDLYRDELASLAENSRRRAALEESIRIAERNTHAAERLLAHYGDGVLSPREALHYADERLFLAYRYLYGLTMEATAIEMNVSRDTVYRIRRRIVARGAVPAEDLHRFGIVDLSFQGDSRIKDTDSACDTVGHGEDALHRSAHTSLPRCAPTASESDDVADVLAACFAGAPGGIPGALLARR
ncbi:MAG: sigma-70 family RNA polymerase sigma factor [Clostridia bacterium]|nr:sigma-70 family RNA polymerase sigma factor [Clostridia bacterium]